MDVVLKELETLIYIPVSRYKGHVSGNNNLQFPLKPTMQSSQNCQKLNPTPFQMTERGQVLQRKIWLFLWVLCHCFIQVITVDHQVFPLLRSLASDIFIYAAHNRRLLDHDENFSYIRSVACFTCHALKMWSNTDHDVYSISLSHLSCHSLLYCPRKQTSQEIKKMPFKLPLLAKVQNQSFWRHKLLQFHMPHNISNKKNKKIRRVFLPPFGPNIYFL